MPFKKYFRQKEVIKLVKKWFEGHKSDSSYNLSIGKDLKISQKGTGMDDSQFTIMLNEVKGIRTDVKDLGDRLDGIDTRLTSLETKVDGIDTRLTSLETKVDKHIKEGH